MLAGNVGATMPIAAKLPLGLLIVAILVGLLLASILLVGGCTAMLWNAVGGDEASGARRDALRERHGPLLVRLATTAGEASDLLDAATRLRSVRLPPQVLGLAIAQADDDAGQRIAVLQMLEGRQTSRLLINGTGTVTLTVADGEAATFDLLETEATLRDGTRVDIELILAPDVAAEGPE